MVKKKYKFIFIVLAYRNDRDVKEFLKSLSPAVSDFKVLIVNAYYDDNSKEKIKKIAAQYQCDFMNIENKGYGFGNNRGFEYALEHYECDYFIVSNPDIIVKEFDESVFVRNSGKVIGPEIETVSGKKQNPMNISRCMSVEKIKYIGFKYNLKLLVLAGIAFNKIKNQLIMKSKKGPEYNVYQLHGCFLALPYSLIKENVRLYDEQMFLFAEESYLADLLNRKGYLSCYTDRIKVLHKEDGSMNFIRDRLNGMLKESYVYYYETYMKKGKD